MADAVLSLEGLTAGYDDAAVIRDVDLTVGPGEVVALLGANGAGKTTTLRVDLRARQADGRAACSSPAADLARTSPSARARLGIAHVPEGRGLFFGLTVGEHFRLGHRRRARSTSEVAYKYFPTLAELTRIGAPASSPAGSSRCSRSRGLWRGSRSCCSSTSSASGSRR